MKAITMLLTNIPFDLKAQFKSECAKQGITMRQAFIRFMLDFISVKSREDKNNESST